MRHRRQDPHTPWIIEPDPTVPQPTAMGRAVLKLWIEEQLRMVAVAREGRRHRRRTRRHERDAPGSGL